MIQPAFRYVASSAIICYIFKAWHITWERSKDTCNLVVIISLVGTPRFLQFLIVGVVRDLGPSHHESLCRSRDPLDLLPALGGIRHGTHVIENRFSGSSPVLFLVDFWFQVPQYVFSYRDKGNHDRGVSTYGMLYISVRMSEVFIIIHS